MRSIKPGVLLLLLATLLTLSSCGVPGAVDTPTPIPTATSAPTAPPVPTNTIAPPPTPTAVATNTPLPAPSDTPVPASQILYLDPDGATIKSVQPDGTGTRTVAKIDKPDQGSVTYLGSDPTGQYILYGTTKSPDDYQPQYILIDGLDQGGPSIKLGALFGQPRWSVGGNSFTGETFKADGTPGQIAVFDVQSGQSTTYPIEGVPDFLNDGKRLVYVFKDNVYTYDPDTKKSTQVTKLPNDDQNAWVVQEAHPLPSGTDITFYGGQFKKDGQLMLGAQGNGQQWWDVPMDGSDKPRSSTDPGGNYAPAYATSPNGVDIAFVDSGHSSACVNAETVGLIDGLAANIPELAESDTGAGAVEGISWSPDGTVLAIGVHPYSCADPGSGRSYSTPSIYMWDINKMTTQGQQPVRFLEGSFPVWVR